MGSGPYPRSIDFSPPAAPEPSREEARTDLLALVFLQRAGATGTAAGVIGGLVGVYALLELGATLETATSGASPSPPFLASAGFLDLGLLLILLGGTLQMAGMGWYLLAFRTLRNDDLDFEGPALRISVGLFSIPIFLLSFAMLEVSLVAFANCANSLPAGSTLAVSCSSQTTNLQAWGLFAFTSAAPTLFGLWGVLWGVWRLEAHFDGSSFQLAAILLFLAFLPFAVAIGSLLVWTESHKLAARPVRRARPT
ncbi:MAG TPA: hypothetical protein VGU43_00720 [Thermoplasmata archaeon]|nr:hypothetical protein [Thermoplasmata archaeon]